MLQSRSVIRAALVDHLKNALTGEKNHFFADTSFLIAAASLSPTARGELRRWIESLGDRFHVPAWVALEIYGKISTGQDLFAPMARVANEAIKSIQALLTEARRYLDTPRAKEFWGRPDRVGLLSDLDRGAGPLLRRAAELKEANKTADEAIEFLVELVNGTVLSSDIYSGLPDLDSDYAARVIGGQPPGFMDKGKAERTRHGDNRYGDLIIWREIIAFARATDDLAGVVLLTNDNKPDWVYVPAAILDDRGRPLGNDAKRGFKIILPLPLLSHELRTARKDAELTIANLGMVSQMLHPELGLDAANLFSAYQPLVTGEREAAAAVGAAAAAAAAGDVAPGGREEVTPVWADEGGAVPEVDRRAPSLDDLPNLLTSLAGLDVEAAAAAAASIRPLIGSHATTQLVPRLADGLVMAAERGIEAAMILIRDIVTDSLPIDRALRGEILAAMIAALYYDAEGHLRQRPLAAALPDLFGVQTLAELKPAVDALNARLGPRRRVFLLTPDPAAATLSLSVPTERDEEGRQRIRGIYLGKVPLHEDVARGSERSLTRLLGGAAEATGADLKRVLAGYFRVPEAQLDIGLARFDPIAWDSLTGLVDWGADTGLELR